MLKRFSRTPRIQRFKQFLKASNVHFSFCCLRTLFHTIEIKIFQKHDPTLLAFTDSCKNFEFMSPCLAIFVNLIELFLDLIHTKLIHVVLGLQSLQPFLQQFNHSLALKSLLFLCDLKISYTLRVYMINSTHHLH